jgi:hypothetical protein
LAENQRKKYSFFRKILLKHKILWYNISIIKCKIFLQKEGKMKLKPLEDELLEMFAMTEDDLLLNKAYNQEKNFYEVVEYRKLDRVECALLVYYYKYLNSDIAYQILFEEIFIIYKRHLKKYHNIKTSHVRRAKDSVEINYEDLYQDYYIIFAKIIDSFVITSNHSFKKYSDLVVCGELAKLMREKYFFGYRTPVSSKINPFDLSEFLFEDGHEDTLFNIEDPSYFEDEVIDRISLEHISQILKKFLTKHEIDLKYFDMFLKYHGIGCDKKYKQRELAEMYRCSISNVCKKIGLIKDAIVRSEVGDYIVGELGVDFLQSRKKSKTRYY